MFKKFWPWKKIVAPLPLRTPIHDIIDEMDGCYEKGDKERYNYLIECLDKIQQGKMEIKDIKPAECKKDNSTPPIILN